MKINKDLVDAVMISGYMLRYSMKLIYSSQTHVLKGFLHIFPYPYFDSVVCRL